MIEQKTMFGVAAIGLTAVVGYGLYKYVQGRQHTTKDQRGSGRDGTPRNFRDLVSLQAWLSYLDPLHVAWNWLHSNQMALFVFLEIFLAVATFASKQTGLFVKQLSCLMYSKYGSWSTAFLILSDHKYCECMPHQEHSAHLCLFIPYFIHAIFVLTYCIYYLYNIAFSFL